MRLFETMVKFTNDPSLLAPRWVRCTIDLDRIISVSEHPENGIYDSCYVHSGDFVSAEYKITYDQMIKEWKG